MQGFLEYPPQDEEVTSYDRQHLDIYLLLLKAEEQGADWKVSYKKIFDDEPDNNLAQPHIIYQSHLKRARWMTTHGFKFLLE